MNKKLSVKLTGGQRNLLESLITGGKASARSQTHARVLLKADEGEQGPRWSDQRISEALEVGTATVERVRKRFVEGGLLDAVVRRPQPERSPLRKLDGEKEARLIALTCSQHPSGKSRWSMRLLANTMVELDEGESVSHETVRRVLKKMRESPGKRSNGVFLLKRTPNSSLLWRMCFASISVLMILGGLKSVWMKSIPNCWLMYENPFLSSRERSNVRITNMSEKEWDTCF
jgi:transposase